MTDNSNLLTTADVAAMVKVKPVTARVWRYRGTGPRYLRLSDRIIRYREADVLSWLSTREVD